ncbi:hypothetical protein PTE30175_04605 [Pandoraea terrae]|uniref:Deaminase n=1 Tax=Pandoraea terrae TaxID=1537710 RepID=A0A5E4YRZ4_9BURK|nr:PP0621 family protein [Pandoraea terrae]VVE51267.1 hypothetical protein PTE30175_04605 [Pandoraea terrae]
MRNILLLLLLLVAGTWWMRRKERRDQAERVRTSGAQRGVPPQRDALPPAERMVRCAQCGTYLPESEALAGADDAHFCSAAHQQAFLARPR